MIATPGRGNITDIDRGTTSTHASYYDPYPYSYDVYATRGNSFEEEELRKMIFREIFINPIALFVPPKTRPQKLVMPKQIGLRGVRLDGRGWA